jgi:hypothetical protein
MIGENFAFSWKFQIELREHFGSHALRMHSDRHGNKVHQDSKPKRRKRNRENTIVSNLKVSAGHEARKKYIEKS